MAADPGDDHLPLAGWSSAVLATMEPVDDDFPDVDEGLQPLNPGPDLSLDAGQAL